MLGIDDRSHVCRDVLKVEGKRTGEYSPSFGFTRTGSLIRIERKNLTPINKQREIIQSNKGINVSEKLKRKDN